MAYTSTTSRVTAPLKTYWFSYKDKDLMDPEMGPSTGSNVGTLCMMRNTQERLQRHLEKDSKKT